MKKTLLISGLLLGSFFSLNAQVLESQNFNALTIGNVGTATTGDVAGQGGYFTFIDAGGTNASNSSFQIVTDAAPGRQNVLQIIGSNAATGTRLMFKDGLNDAWGSRTAGEIIQLEFSFFTGPVTTSTSTLRPAIFGADGNPIGGFNFAMNTKILQGYAWGDFNDTGTPGPYVITLGAAPVVLPANTWVKVGFAYDTLDGRFQWKCNDVTPAVNGGLDGDGGYEPDEFDILYFASAQATTNAVSSTVKFDDYSLTAVPAINLLSVDKVVADNNFSVYPNPATNVVNIKSSVNTSMQTVSITDLNGRTVKTNTVSGNEAQINISDLASGVYMMNINSDEGSVTKKIVKK